MNWLETLRTGLEAVRTHRLRSTLTVLGILIGIAAVILTVGLGLGAQTTISAQVDALGSNLLIVTPGSTTTGGVRGGLGSASTLTQADAEALADPTVAPDVKAVAPIVQRREDLVAGSTNWTTTIVGTTPDWLSVRARTVSSGRFLTPQDVSDGGAVTVLGSSTATELFGPRDPVGQSVTVNGIPFTVVGVLASAGSSAASNEDDQAVIPISTASARLVGGATAGSVQTIYVQAHGADLISAAYQEIDAELAALHRTTDPTSADYTIATQQSLLSTANSIARTLTVLLGGIAAISLLVGGIGVMNIMLVSVTERLREIGLRKALGATPRAIRRQFLVESSVLGLVGGLLGLGLGVVGALLLPRVISNPVTISPAAAVGALAVAVGIGVAFGVYPASRAARLAPIDALRSE
ncbi:ABC transporter permease [Actinopolymorpha pittospori]|uniref:ABC transport system permease protein n=1 Tax=Actinopolymorpha pittospori TaxID=648752 RepID=A0A927MV16_9ACTN|nr:putative ABC transport system permease protein [Actinopolymorpha pittospori]